MILNGKKKITILELLNFLSAKKNPYRQKIAMVAKIHSGEIKVTIP
jgi:hypothetical protein